LKVNIFENVHFSLSLPRYLVVLYYQATKAFEKLNTQKKEDDLKKMKEKYDLKTPGRN
jgi:hypothetical protein